MKVYPLDHKFDNGSLFWTLPKRAPTVVKYDSINEIHASFVAACACLRAVTCKIAIPSNPRDHLTKFEIADKANYCLVK